MTTIGGQKVVVHAGKTAWVYVLDAATGKLVRRTDNFTPQENMFALPTAAGTRMLPGANGGSEWSPIAVDPKLGYAFVTGLHQPMNYIPTRPRMTPGVSGSVRPSWRSRVRSSGHLQRHQSVHRQDRVAEQGPPADDGRRAGHGPAV